MSKTFNQRFLDLKQDLFVGKGVRNAFAGFNYRTRPQISAALKPLEKEYNMIIVTTTDIVMLGHRIFIKGIARAFDVEDRSNFFEAQSFAEIQDKAGTKMSEPQLTGSSDTYAVKNALLNLFGLTDEEVVDPDQDQVETKLGITHKEIVQQGNTVGDKQTQDEATFKNLVMKTPITSYTKEIVNEFLDTAEKLKVEEIIFTMINAKAKNSSLDIKYNATTKRWE